MEPTTETNAKTEAIESQEHRRKPWLVLGLAILLLGGLVYGIIVSYGSPKSGVNVSAAETPFDLPEGATKVSFAFEPTQWAGYAYEFDISEQELRAWAQKRGYSIAEIAGVPVQIDRYIKYAKDRNSSDGEPQITITEGLHAESTLDPGTGFAFAYDRKTGRAYFCGLGR